MPAAPARSSVDDFPFGMILVQPRQEEQVERLPVGLPCEVVPAQRSTINKGGLIGARFKVPLNSTNRIPKDCGSALPGAFAGTRQFPAYLHVLNCFSESK